MARASNDALEIRGRAHVDPETVRARLEVLIGMGLADVGFELEVVDRAGQTVRRLAGS